jgi:hypothetical protein
MPFIEVDFVNYTFNLLPATRTEGGVANYCRRGVLDFDKARMVQLVILQSVPGTRSFQLTYFLKPTASNFYSSPQFLLRTSV